MIDVYFSRPGSDSEVMERLKIDVKYAKKRVFISQYVLKESELKLLLKDCTTQKRLVLNRSLENEKIKKNYVVLLGSPKNISNMHHKFIIVDDVLWVGSMNISFNAMTNNWENMMRITEPAIVEKYLIEFKKLFILGKTNADIFKDKCIDSKCKYTVNDPLNHYQVIVTYEQIVEEYYSEYQNGQEYTTNSKYNDKDNRIIYSLVCKEQDPIVSYNDETRCFKCHTYSSGKALHRIQYQKTTEYYQRYLEGEEVMLDFSADPVMKEDIYETGEAICLECLYQMLEDKEWLTE